MINNVPWHCWMSPDASIREQVNWWRMWGFHDSMNEKIIIFTVHEGQFWIFRSHWKKIMVWATCVSNFYYFKFSINIRHISIWPLYGDVAGDLRRTQYNKCFTVHSLKRFHDFTISRNPMGLWKFDYFGTSWHQNNLISLH